MSDALRYPIGRMQRPAVVSSTQRQAMIDQIAEAPALLRAAVNGLMEAQMDTPFREGGWSVRQVVSHVSDSHINAYVRFRWTLTEEIPTIKAYDQNLWAELADAKSSDVETSLVLLETLHRRWVTLLRSLSEEDFRRALHHPEDGPMTLDDLLCTYAWHGRHHAAHITALRARKGW